MKNWIRSLALALVAGVGVLADEPPVPSDAREPSKALVPQDVVRGLAVLYAGDPDDARAARFREFLASRVGRLEAASLRDLDADRARGFDVVVADWHPRYGPEGFTDDRPHGVELPRTFRTPVVMLGAVAGELVGKWSKIQWSDLTLGNEAHDPDLDHPVFKGPLVPDLGLTRRALTPEEREHPLGPLPETRTVWRVQDGEPGKDLDYGLVSDGYGFEDSPDAERIAGGANQDDPRAVAIARHGTFFLWGFSADPSRMTGGAKDVFLNLLVHAKGFAGRTAAVERRALSREWALRYSGFLRTLAGNERTCTWLRGCFCDDVRSATSLEPQRMQDYLPGVSGYLRAKGRGFEVDQDLRALGAANRDLAFFERVGQRLREDPRDAVALRLLDRYAADVAAPADAAALDAWLGRHRDRLFFTDVGGYRWLMDDR